MTYLKPSKLNPFYRCVVVTRENGSFDLNCITTKLDLSWRKKQLAQCAKVKCMNVKRSGKYLNSLIGVRDRLFVYANDGETNQEVFRGFIWTVNYSSALQKELTFTCYDNLIYFQESEDNRYFSPGYSSKAICQNICASWGIMLEYSYSSITHGKMSLKGALSNIFLTQILEKVRKQTGDRYVVRSEQDVMKILNVGTNTTVYKLKSKTNVITESSEVTMDGMITKVLVLGKADDDGQSPIEAVVTGETDVYGVLQKIQNKNETTSLDDAKKEAEQTIKDSGKPTRTFEVEAMDIPWIKLGDKVTVAAGNALGDFIVTGITHSIRDDEKTMRVTLEYVKL